MTLLHPDDDQRIAYALDELEAHEREAVGAHLDGCGICAGEVERLARALESERAPGGGTAPLHVLIALLGRQANARQRRAKWHRLARAAVAAALGGFVFIGGYWQGRHTLVPRTPHHRPIENRTPMPPLPPLPFATAVTAATSADQLAYTPNLGTKALGDSRTRGDSL